jgi:hypothetical protein
VLVNGGTPLPFTCHIDLSTPAAAPVGLVLGRSQEGSDDEWFGAVEVPAKSVAIDVTIDAEGNIHVTAGPTRLAMKDVGRFDARHA